ncbi:MAG: 2-C-methyl-D-erythritol 4-phosphate cytidylyltransferase, partial [Candidatus Binatia bacterium]
MTEEVGRRREVVALIPAAGLGKRMGEDCPKQFLPLKGKPLLFYTLQRFQATSSIDYVYLVVPKEKGDFCPREIVGRLSHPLSEKL